MNVFAIIGAVLVLLAVLGFVGLIATGLAVEIILLVVGLLLIAYGSGHLGSGRR